jgi:hypothetical protein
MLEMGQSYPPSRKLDFPSLIEEQFTKRGVREKITPGMRLAVGVGSRGITTAFHRAGDGKPRRSHCGGPSDGPG